MGMYEGGIPAQGGKNLYPAEAGSEAVVKPDNGPQKASYSMTGPATFGESEGGKQPFDGSGYAPAGEERAGGMKIRDLNDISHDA